MSVFPSDPVHDVVSELDLRGLPVPVRYVRVFMNYAVLLPGQGFVVRSEHDLVPLRTELVREQGERATWTDLEQGPEGWSARIGRR